MFAQRVLEAVFGDNTVRQLAQFAKANLDSRITELLNVERSRYDQILDGLGVDTTAPATLSEVLTQIENANPTVPRLAKVV